MVKEVVHSIANVNLHTNIGDMMKIQLLVHMKNQVILESMEIAIIIEL